MFSVQTSQDSALTGKSPFVFGSPIMSPPSPSSVADAPFSITKKEQSPIKESFSPADADPADAGGAESKDEDDPFSAINVDDMIIVWPTSGG